MLGLMRSEANRGESLNRHAKMHSFPGAHGEQLSEGADFSLLPRLARLPPNELDFASFSAASGLFLKPLGEVFVVQLFKADVVVEDVERNLMSQLAMKLDDLGVAIFEELLDLFVALGGHIDPVCDFFHLGLVVLKVLVLEDARDLDLFDLLVERILQLDSIK